MLLHIFSLIYFLFGLVNSRTYNVKTIEEVNQVLNRVSNKDIIQLNDGLFTGTVKWTLNKNEVILRAKNLGRVTLSGLVHISLNGNNNTLSGIQFANNLPKNSAKNVIEINGDYNLVTECNFVNYTAKRYIHISAHTKYNTITF